MPLLCRHGTTHQKPDLIGEETECLYVVSEGETITPTQSRSLSSIITACLCYEFLWSLLRVWSPEEKEHTPKGNYFPPKPDTITVMSIKRGEILGDRKKNLMTTLLHPKNINKKKSIPHQLPSQNGKKKKMRVNSFSKIPMMKTDVPYLTLTGKSKTHTTAFK